MYRLRATLSVPQYMYFYSRPRETNTHTRREGRRERGRGREGEIPTLTYSQMALAKNSSQDWTLVKVSYI